VTGGDISFGVGLHKKRMRIEKKLWLEIRRAGIYCLPVACDTEIPSNGCVMKTIAFAMLVVLASAVFALGAACPTATYDNYLGGQFSCGIDDKTFSNFSYSTAGSNQMPAGSIAVNPITVPFNPGFLFNAPWGVQAGQTQSSLIGFTVNVNPGGNLIDDLSLYMFGAGIVGTGQVSVTETYCAGDTFADACAHGTEGTLLTMLNSSQSRLHDSVSFAGVSVVDVVKDVELSGGANGSAAVVSGVQNQFSEVPEPGSLMLFGSGVVCLADVLRRKMKF
jgi:hypothetical protein